MSRSKSQSRSNSSASRKPTRDRGKGSSGKGREPERILRCSNKNFRDDVSQVVDEHDGEELAFSQLDFSRNSLTLNGVKGVVDICRRCPDLRILKLFNNDIDDEGAVEVAGIFAHCPKIDEIHLSHNRITRNGAEAIIKAADYFLDDDSATPLWLRLEHNDIDNAEEFARDLERDFLSVCGREDRSKCMPRVCAKGKRIHVPFLIERAKGAGRDRSSGVRRGNFQRCGRRRSREFSRPRSGVREQARPGARHNCRSPPLPRGQSPPLRGRYDYRDQRRPPARCNHCSRSRTPPGRNFGPARTRVARDENGEVQSENAYRPTRQSSPRAVKRKGPPAHPATRMLVQARALAVRGRSADSDYTYTDYSAEPEPQRAAPRAPPPRFATQERRRH